MSTTIKRGPRAAATYRANRQPAPKQYRQAQRKARIATHSARPSAGKAYAPNGKRECARRLRQVAGAKP